MRSQGETQVDGTALAALELHATVAKLRRDYDAIAASVGALVRAVATRADTSQWSAEQLSTLLRHLDAAAVFLQPLSASLAGAIARAEALAAGARIQNYP